MKLALTSPGSNSGETIEISDATFAREFNEPLIHQVVVAQMAAERAGTKKQKTRAEVSGGGIKPWRQKGTGRARAGTIRSPIWRHGGKTFAAVPRDHAQKVNKKMHLRAMQSILSELVRQERLIAVKDFTLDAPKTKSLVAKMKSFGLTDVLIVVKTWDENLYLAARNVPRVRVIDSSNISPVYLLKFSKVIMTLEAIKHCEEVLA